ncbi:DUF7439 family protein [Streptomyces asiaticus]|uniref:DUF7439 family protein n=1 Tax=Streptomyces asiaticus TaxID=114695 RepID=UPI003F674E7C
MATKLTGAAKFLFDHLPTRYRSKAGLIIAALGVVVSILTVAATDHPEVAVVIQALTALGFVEKPESPKR